MYMAAGATRSEGGFAANKVQSASLLDVSVAKDKSGKSYYKCGFTIPSHKIATSNSVQRYA